MIRCDTRSGWRAAYSIEIAPPCDTPNRIKRSSESESTTHSRSLTHRSIEISTASRCDNPVPRPSYRMNLCRLAIPRMRWRQTGLSSSQMGPPVRRPHDWRSLAHRGIGNAHAIRGGRVLNMLFHRCARPMQVISPFTAGNANDTVARVVLDQVSRQLGQPFVIENKPGGGGTIGPAMVAKADPDGYTILLHSSSLSSQVVLHRTLPYDPIRDFAPVVVFGIQPNVLVAAPSTGFKTVADLVAAAKARPGALSYASAGIGSASHMAAERLRLAAGINVQHIPFRGAEGMAEVMAGRIDFYFVPIAPAVPVITDGKVAVLRVSIGITPLSAASPV